MLHRLSSFILQAFGWSISGAIPQNPKFIIVAGPHTSNWDFILGVLTRSALQLNTKFIGKSQLFKPPYGWFFRAMGGYPVDRSKNNRLVDAVAEIFRSKEEFSIALSPEGTRKQVSELKTGFYHIAAKARVPIYMVGFDYQNRQVLFADPFLPSQEAKSDIAKVKQFFQSCQGKRPEFGVAS
ncbi:1-acyl-sn-glycerol-3-phosphate acyltransferase [Pontibacter sp. G13]|uniref:1-acyl-sn-glycerol-3-phosphate acyltransferase n=1 Tax=Pontibacter sp. G13 TaxID=3074898 RepID=UPI00288AD34C|nr:1-acyl-sn-glycerol-3-phosphate acyltransferase [Pontibacter sp. G13]WNJ21193.1 1-acyl-sn-glycerol-3-phosphate acyltransferase [Pontibacter sp. G13]